MRREGCAAGPEHPARADLERGAPHFRPLPGEGVRVRVRVRVRFRVKVGARVFRVRARRVGLVEL